MRVVFMGTPDFAVPSLRALVENGYRPVAVVTGPDRPRGRGRKLQPAAVKQAAQRFGIKTLIQPESVKDPAFAAQINDLNCDLQIIVAFRILPPEVFTCAKLGAFNLHASLLPKFRGAAPINRALMAGVTETGVTTFFLKPAVDTGNIILQWPTVVPTDETAGSLHDRLAKLGARAVLETTRRIATGNVQGCPQDNSLATAAPKIFRDDCRIRWTDSADQVHNHCRGLSPYPGAWTPWKSGTLKILGSRVTEGTGSPGTVLRSDGHIVVACKTGAISITHLQAPGQRVLAAKDFLNGHPIVPGSHLSGQR
ncbi:MAG: methionyl-tRNA formyltransferase [Rhodothermaceae bacterium]|nr:methionyl-tRNA formyltransferase [Rhodothermaceae bacterium]MYD67344.1 methionyl-tRNA formyltransferase [Rhodothermaceae bacterium]MYJ08056.1 methionyl-tRNA formyltransferase [Rhodothermaceae bacterium]